MYCSRVDFVESRQKVELSATSRAFRPDQIAWITFAKVNDIG